MAASAKRPPYLPAVVVIAAMWASAACDGPQPDAPTPVSPVPPSASSEPSLGPLTRGPIPPVTALRVGGAVGDPPTLPYVRLRTVHFPRGRQVVLERPPDPQPDTDREDLSYVAGLSYQRLVHFDGGWVGSTYDNMQYVTTLHRPDGSFVRLLRPGFEWGPGGVTANGRWVLLGDGTGVKELDSHDLSTLRRIYATVPSSVIQFFREPVGYTGRRTGVVNVYGPQFEARRVVLVTPDGVRRALTDMRRVTATSQHLLAGATQRGPQARADTVVDRHGKVVLRTPGIELVAFNPGATLVLGTSKRFSHRTVLISVATGEVLLHLRISPHGLAWEDDDHLLALRSRAFGESRRIDVLRISVDGAAELALRTTLPANNHSLFTLTTEPGDH